MADLLIPTSSDPHYVQTTSLDGTAYTLTFKWNRRAERWSLTLGTADGEPIIEGIALVTGCDLLKGYRYLPECPPGILVCSPLGSDDATPGIVELGEGLRVVLTYAEPDEE